MISRNIETLAKALEPDAFRPQVGWHDRHQEAVRSAKLLLSSNSPGDHMRAAMMLTLAMIPEPAPAVLPIDGKPDAPA